jgi:hypothetical protein
LIVHTWMQWHRQSQAADSVLMLEQAACEAGARLREARMLLEQQIYEHDVEAAGLSGAVVSSETARLASIQRAEEVVERLRAAAQERQERLEEARLELRRCASCPPRLHARRPAHHSGLPCHQSAAI